MNKSVIIIGAGWYGCYIAMQCKNRGIDYVVYEKANEIFTGSSSYNQNRLHLGFHYPRNFKTRIDSKRGFEKFISTFPKLSTIVNRNVYSVHKDSLIDFQTYINIFEHEKYNFEVLNENISDNFQGSILVNERYIDPFKSKDYFSNLNLNIKFDSNVYFKNQEYFLNNLKLSSNVLINATYGGIESPVASKQFFKQKFLSFIIKKTVDSLPFDALTVMDGLFYSIFPYNQKLNLYTLTHVKYGVINNNLSKHEIDNLYRLVNFSIIADFPDFDKYFKFESFFVSNKYKSKSKTDLRSTLIFKEENVFTVCSGKIDTVFLADEIINDLVS
tara:strand:+ start:14965 stop:15951 length:987 start_codon:yes stop_codon:yes gene_type:complete